MSAQPKHVPPIVVAIVEGDFDTALRLLQASPVTVDGLFHQNAPLIAWITTYPRTEEPVPNEEPHPLTNRPAHQKEIMEKSENFSALFETCAARWLNSVHTAFLGKVPF